MKYSIVIAVMNGAETLRKTLGSVFTQTYPGWEIVVQDGGSTDGTLAILKDCGKDVDWRSEPDTGIYDAWNKALDRVTGDWVLFLGADDCLLHRHVLAQCGPYLAALPDDILFAYGTLLMSNGPDDKTALRISRSLHAVYHQILQDMPMPFPATFIRSSAFRGQRFDTRYAIAGDYEFAARLATRSNIARLPVWVAYMLRGGISDNPATAQKLFRERDRILRTVVASRAGEFVQGLADHFLDYDISMDPIPEQ
ncbi:Glycosyl transferase family 2 (fragment) [uncultured delta proteobacterium]|uniref:Glycosyl transferase family 2 n=1 Tax=uncultured delta proteobacterium TaxID=34034 RepID=A0A212JHR3_9DELT